MSLRRFAIGLVAMMLASSITVLAQRDNDRDDESQQLVILSASYDQSSQTLTISGGAFGRRPPVVTLNGQVLTTFFSAGPSSLVLHVPGALTPGTYLLTVSRSRSSNGFAAFDVTVGAVGATGPTGPKGDQGPAGAPGDVGPAGPKGDKGDPGPQGLKGDKGDTGPQGLKGDTGAQGLKGDPGSQGLKGDKGDTGAQGPKGDTGATGPQGGTGPQGPIGPTGPTGPAGPTANIDALTARVAALEAVVFPFKRIFITADPVSPNFGGVAGGDAACQAAAQAAGLAGTFKAWLSDSSASAASRLAHSTLPYQLVTGETVASNWNDLVDGSLQHAINTDQFGVTHNSVPGVPPFDHLSFPPYTLSGTNSDGSATSFTCSNWTDASGGSFFFYGNGSVTDSRWSRENSVAGCDANTPPPRLFCLQQ